MNVIRPNAECGMNREHQQREGYEAQQIGHSPCFEGVNAQTGAVLDNVAATVAGAQTQQNEDAAGNSQKSVAAQQQQDEMVVKILLG